MQMAFRATRQGREWSLLGGRLEEREREKGRDGMSRRETVCCLLSQINLPLTLSHCNFIHQDTPLYSGKLLIGRTWAADPSKFPKPYECHIKVNKKMKDTLCSPIFSLHYMLAELLDFDIDLLPTNNFKLWHTDLLSKVKTRHIFQL